MGKNKQYNDGLILHPYDSGQYNTQLLRSDLFPLASVTYFSSVMIKVMILAVNEKKYDVIVVVKTGCKVHASDILLHTVRYSLKDQLKLICSQLHATKQSNLLGLSSNRGPFDHTHVA